MSEQAGGRPGFDLLGTSTYTPADVEVVYGIIGRWQSRSASEALPFFSKIHLRQAISVLTTRGYRVSLAAIDVMPTTAAGKVQ